MLHTFGPHIYDRGHQDVEHDPSDELLRVQICTGREMVFHVLKTWKDSSQDVLNAKSSSPRLNGKPDETQDDALDERYVLSSNAPNVAGDDTEADVPGGANVAIRDCHECDDNLADDDGNNGLPNRDSCGY
jgi:hypothetical protein